MKPTPILIAACCFAHRINHEASALARAVAVAPAKPVDLSAPPIPTPHTLRAADDLPEKMLLTNSSSHHFERPIDGSAPRRGKHRGQKAGAFGGLRR